MITQEPQPLGRGGVELHQRFKLTAGAGIGPQHALGAQRVGDTAQIARVRDHRFGVSGVERGDERALRIGKALKQFALHQLATTPRSSSSILAASFSASMT